MNPQWLDGVDKEPMFDFEVSDKCNEYVLPIIEKCIYNNDKIPWHFRDYTFKLLNTGFIQAD